MLVKTDRLVRAGDRRHAEPDVRQFAEPERTDRHQRAALAQAADFEGLVGQRIVDHADLDSDRFILHHGGNPLDLPVCRETTLLALALRQIVGADETGAQQTPHLCRTDDAGETRAARADRRLALGENLDQQIDLRLGLLPVWKFLRQPLQQHVMQDPGILVRRQQKRDRLVIDQHALGLCFDLAQPLEIGQRAGKIFRADPEQRRQRRLQQFGDALEGLELHRSLALLVIVERGARDPELFGGIFGRQAKAHPVRPQPLSDLKIIDRHEILSARD